TQRAVRETGGRRLARRLIDPERGPRRTAGALERTIGGIHCRDERAVIREINLVHVAERRDVPGAELDPRRRAATVGRTKHIPAPCPQGKLLIREIDPLPTLR